MELEAAWRVRVITPKLKSGGFLLKRAEQHESGNTITLRAGDEFLGYETAPYGVEARAEGGVGVRHYQFTPHDTRDWDAAHVPVLTDFEWQGRKRKAMLFANKNGLLYALDRATGQFLYGKPFVEVNWMDGFDEKGRPVEVMGRIGGAEKAMTLPGVATNWQPPSYSPATGLFYVSSWERGTVDGRMERPSPAYGAMRAFDPKTGIKKWEFKKSDAVFHTGALSTASGLLFTGIWGDYYSGDAAASLLDGYFYALDANTGHLLWQMSLAGSVYGGPMTYSVRGKQYVAVAAGNTLFAFALRQ